MSAVATEPWDGSLTVPIESISPALFDLLWGRTYLAAYPVALVLEAIGCAVPPMPEYLGTLR